jgi:hypothetical protein
MTFQQGQSGNPSGRPKGIIDRRAELRSLLDPHAKEIIDKLIECAKAGDPAALRLCVERLIPRVKPDSGINFDLPEGCIDTGDNMLKIANDVTTAVSCGLLTIDEAEKFTEFLKHQRWLIDEAKRKKESEVSDAEWKKRWAKNNTDE